MYVVPTEPGVIVAVAVAAWLYWRGVRALWTRAGRGRGVAVWQAACFAGGLSLLLVALASPLDGLSADLFAAHMVQHLLLMLGAAPLVALGAPLTPMLWGAPAAMRRPIAAMARARFMRSVTVGVGLHSLSLWVWHIPALYDLALQNRAVHVLEHASFVGTALVFWWAILHAGHAAYGLGVLSVFALAMQSTILGALLTFAPRVWYSVHAARATAWAMTPLEDQQIAGLIMWVPGGSIYLACALGLFAAWLRQSDRRPDRAAHTPARR